MMRAAATAFAIALALAPVLSAQTPSSAAGGELTLDALTLDYATNRLAADRRSAFDTSAATIAAALAVETARFDLARHELRAARWYHRWRPKVDLFASVSMRGLAFPAISAQGFDPGYAAVARWPGDTWGVTVSWSLDQLLDRRPLHRARAEVRVAQARVELAAARREQQQRARRDRTIADQQRRRAEQRRADLAATQLRIQQRFLARKLAAHQELLRLAEMQYEQGEIAYGQLAQARLAVLSAEHAAATNSAQRAALDAGALPGQLVSADPDR
jgi:hypothetical protein